MHLMLFSWLLLVLRNVNCRSPVIIVPGTGGNQIEAKLVGKPSKPAWYCYSTTSSYYTLWLDIKSLFPLALDCWIDNFRLVWDMETMTVRNSPGVLTRNIDFGETTSFETIDSTGLVKYMKPFVDYLVTLGYTRGKDIRGAPYDFRYSPDQMPDNYFEKFKSLIESTYTVNGNEPVTLVSHSYGCPVTLYLLSLQTQDWKNKYIKQWITLSGVFGGTKQQVQLYAAGLLMDVPRFVVDPLKIRGEQRTSTSNLFMLPGEMFWPKDDVIARTRQRAYTIMDIDDFLRDVGYPDGVTMRHHIVNSTYLMSKSPGVKVHCFYGNIKSSTVETLEYTDDFPGKPSNLIMGDGDGTVNYQSLKLCERFVNDQKRQGSISVIPGVAHTPLISDKSVLAAVSNLLS